MFLLRIAEALVNSQEAHYTSSLTSHPNLIETNGHRSGSGSPMETSSTAVSAVSGESTTSELLPVGNVNFSPMHLSSSYHSFTPSPSSATTISVRTNSPTPSNSPHPTLPASSPGHDSQLPPYGRRASIGQSSQGLLYNLLVNSETGASQPHSPLQCASPLFTSILKSPSLNLKRPSENDDVLKENINGTQHEESHQTFPLNSSSLSLSKKPSLHSISSLGKGSTKSSILHGSFRNRASSVGSKVSTGRSYLRAYAASVRSASDSFPSTKVTLQHRRNSELPNQDMTNSSTFSAQSHSSSASQDVSTMGSVENSSVFGLGGSHISSPQSSGQPSPKTPRLHHSVPGEFMGKSQSILSYPSFGLAEPHRSLSADSGVDEPVDLTGICTPPTSAAIDMDDSNAQLMSYETNKQVADYESPFVQLAKKTARPVQARVTEWLRQLVEFVALSAPVLGSVSLNQPSHLRSGTNGQNTCTDTWSWVSLLSSSWHRLLVLSMVEHSLDLVVVEHRSAQLECIPVNVELDQLGLPWILLADIQKTGLRTTLESAKRPDRNFSDRLVHLMSELRQASLTAQEFYLLRHAVLLTAQDSSVLPTLGLNVIRTFRSVNLTPEGPKTNPPIPNGSSGDSLSGPFSNDIPVNPSSNTDCFDLACLFSGLKSLSTICPYQMANLFCTHLISGSTLTQSFLHDLHGRVLSSMLHGSGANNGSNATNGVCRSDKRDPDDSAPTVQRLENGTSILEQLFDSY